MTARQGRMCKLLMEHCKENRWYWKLKEKALDRPLWRTRFAKVNGFVLRHYELIEQTKKQLRFTETPLRPLPTCTELINDKTQSNFINKLHMHQLQPLQS